MPKPNINHRSLCSNKLNLDEMNYDAKMLHDELSMLLGLLTDELREIYEEIMNSIESSQGGVFFIYRYGRTRKTFL